MIWLLVLFTSFTAQAFDDCSDVRLDAPGGTLEKVEVRKQVGGTCYAEVAAQLYDSWRFQHGDTRTGKKTSALIAALEYARLNQDIKIDGGIACNIIQHFNEHGMIDENAYNASMMSAKGDLPYALSMIDFTREQYVARLKAARTAYQKKITAESLKATKVDHTFVSTGPFALIDAQTQEERIFYETIQSNLIDAAVKKSSIWFDAFSKTSQVKIENALPELFRLYGESQTAFLSRLVWLENTKAFRYSLNFDQPACTQHSFTENDSNQSILDELNQKISNSRSTPIALGICSNVYQGGLNYHPPGLRSEAGGYFKGSSSDCGAHAALLIGRRKNKSTGKCEYLIRNSNGTNYCPSGLSNHWECEKEIGALWINADKIAEVTTDFVELK